MRSTGRRARLLPGGSETTARDRWRELVAGLALVLLLQQAVLARAAESEIMDLAQRSRAVAADGKLEQALTLAGQARERLARRLESAATPQLQAMLAYLEDDSAAYLSQLGRGAEALTLSEQAVKRISGVTGERSAEFGALAATLGTLRIASGQIDLGIVMLESAYAALPNGSRRARAALGLARTHALVPDPDLSKVWLRRALAADPDDAVRRQIEVAQIEHAIDSGDLPTARRRLRDLERDGGLSAPDRLRLQSSLALAEGRLGAAESILLDLLDALQGGSVEDSLLARSRLGRVYVLMGRIVEAQETYRALLGAAMDAGLSEGHPLVGRTLHALAITYKSLGAYEESAMLYDRAIETLGRSLGQGSEAVGRSRLELSRLLSRMQAHDRAVQEARTALAILSGSGSEHAEGLARASMGFALKDAGRGGESRLHFERAIALLEGADGAWSADLPPGLLALAELDHAADRRDAAEAAVDRAIAILERMDSTSLSGLASAYAIKATIVSATDAPGALAIADRSLNVVGSQLDAIADQRLLSEISESRQVFERYLEVADAGLNSAAVRGRMLIAAQYPKLSVVAATISQTAERGAAANDELAELLERRQRLSQRLAELETRRERELAGLEAEVPGRSTENQRREVRQALAGLGDRIAQDHPAFAERAFPRPVAFGELERRLSDREAVFTLFSGDQHTYLFLLRPGSLETRVSDRSSDEMESLVARIRRSLRFGDSGVPADFASGEAHALYRMLLEPFEAELADVEHLVYVPDRTLAGLPLGLLITEPAADGRRAEYLQSKVALSSMPSLSSFAALRASRPRERRVARLLGVGHPVLGGAEVQASALDLPRSLIDSATPKVHELLPPLASTVLEINEIASTFDDRTVLFQEQASESRLYALPDLDAYSVIVFATHGLLRDDAIGVPEPALVMSPDAKHNGLLLASEIAGLSLDAEWVILSACNTAGPDGSPRAEGLSGLAKAFFFAGARALLVSHWEVNSSAAVLITTRTMNRYRDQEGVGKAHALQQAIERFIEGEYGQEATHPAYWAPFVLVGDGAV